MASLCMTTTNCTGATKKRIITPKMRQKVSKSPSFFQWNKKNSFVFVRENSYSNFFSVVRNLTRLFLLCVKPRDPWLKCDWKAFLLLSNFTLRRKKKSELKWLFMNCLQLRMVSRFSDSLGFLDMFHLPLVDRFPNFIFLLGAFNVLELQNERNSFSCLTARDPDAHLELIRAHH